jgi:CRP-like cAMP-binding protein
MAARAIGESPRGSALNRTRLARSKSMTKQTVQQTKPDPKMNLLLAKLDSKDFESLMASSKVVTLKLSKQLYRQDQPIDSVYFPLTCMGSLVVSTDRKPQMEMATIGKEGAIGAEVCQSGKSLGIILVQLPGTAIQIPVTAFLKELKEHPRLQMVIQRFLYAQTRQILFAASCNRVHGMEERCARWILMTHDRASQDNFPLTQEFLSHMLGVRRATVNVATGMLKKAGFITFVRGRVTVVNRAGLESTACACYEAILKAYTAAMNPLSD